MKILKLNENMPNLDKVVHNDDLNAVTEMPPTMSDAYIDSVEADKAVEDIIKPAEEIIKEKPFLGAEKQPTPKEPEEAKITLDEALFDYFEADDDWEDAAWHDTADQEEEEDIPDDILRDYIDSIEVEEEEDFTESLNESDLAANDLGSYKDQLKIIRLIDKEIPYSLRYKEANFIEDDGSTYLYWVAQEPFTKNELEHFLDSVNDILDRYYDFDIVPLTKLTVRDVSKGYKTDKLNNRLISIDRYGYIENDDWYWKKYSDYLDENLNEDNRLSHTSTKYRGYRISLDHKNLCYNIYDKHGEMEDSGFRSIEDAKKAIDSFPDLTISANWSDETDVEFDESLNESDKSKLSWDELGTEEAEEVDLWTLVYNSLLKERDLGASNSIKKYMTPQLSLKQRYDPVNTDSEGNIIVYGETEEEFNPAKEVAEFHGLKYKTKENPKNWVMKHPEQKYSFTIIIPEDQLNRKLELRNPDVKRGRPKKK